MARLGLHASFDCAFANDIDALKCAVYRDNFGGDDLVENDVWKLQAATIPDAQMAWASFPCQDLSLAGNRRGLNAPRSGAFWGFWSLIEAMAAEGREPQTLALENVPGLLSSRGGRDFTALIDTIAQAGYRVGAMLLDASQFTAQSRTRLFVIARKGRIADGLEGAPDPVRHPERLRRAVDQLDSGSRLAWVWWRLPEPPRRSANLEAALERRPPESTWRSPNALQRLVDQMSPLHRSRFDAALANGQWAAGALYRRIRVERGVKVQRAEVRYDGLAGCIRTPAGGSSNQLLLISEGGEARLRPLLAIEAARLMGCPDDYRLPARESAALKVLGDGVSPPVVEWLAEHLLAPLASSVSATRRRVAA